MHKFTNKEWRDLLIEGWKRDMPLNMIIRHAARLDCTSTADDMSAAVAYAKTRSPAPGSIMIPVRAFFATHAANASEAAWAGNMKAAREALKKPTTQFFAGRRKDVNKLKKDVNEVFFVKKRELSKGSDWKTCK